MARNKISGPMALEGINGNPELLSQDQMKFRMRALAAPDSRLAFVTMDIDATG
jgi:hypothetical protein